MEARRLKILFCEKSQQQAKALQSFFEDKDIDVYFSEFDGRKMLWNIEQICPDIAVMEIYMPHYNAVEVKKLCCDKSYSPKLFVVQGSFDDEDIIESAMEAGFDRYLLRPFDFRLLLDISDKVIAQSRDRMSEFEYLEDYAGRMLQHMAAPMHVAGYGYLRQSIALAVCQPELMNRITKGLYRYIADINGTTVSRVERSMRTAINLIWERGNLAVVDEYFCCGINDVCGKPTNSEFITIVADRLKRQMEKEKTAL